MTMNLQKKISLLTFIFFLLGGCGALKGDHNHTQQASDKIDRDSFHFLLSRTDSDTSNLYSLNPITLEIKPETILLTTSDSMGYTRNTNTSKNLFIVERFSLKGLPSRITLMNSQSDIAQNSLDFPVNLYDLTISNNSLFAVGFEKKEITQSSADLKLLISSRHTIHGFDGNQWDENNLVNILQDQSSNFYVIASGLNWTHPGSQAKVYSLGANPLSNQALIFSPINNCHNIYNSFKISQSKLIISCNPAWDVGTYQPQLILIDVSTGFPLFTFLDTAPQNITYTLGGISADKEWVLITEEEYSTYSYLDPTIKKAYWLNIHSLQRQTSDKGAYQVNYVPSLPGYIYSCLQTQEKKCLQNSFLLSIGNDLNSNRTKTIDISATKNIYGLRAVHFFQEINE